MTNRGEPTSGTKAITVRLPAKDYMLLREHAQERGLSLNFVLSEAVAEYGGKIERQQAIERVHRLQARLQRNKKMGSDSVTLLNEMREERRSREGEQP